MKIWPFAVGILLLLLTPIILASYKTSYTTISYATGLASDAKGTPDLSVWEFSGNFSANDLILVDLLPNILWSNNAGAFDLLDNGMPAMYVDMSITDPGDSVSKYELWYTFNPGDSTRRLTVFNVTALSVGEGIDPTARVPPGFSNPVTFIAGTAELDGTYFANLTFAGAVTDFRWDGKLKPGAFALYYERTIEQKSQPYASLLYLSFVTVPASVISLAYGFKKNNRKQRRQNNEARKT
jgi:hypothetical protein